jgi:3-hydroxybutyryl-CoA dehydrogenase
MPVIIIANPQQEQEVRQKDTNKEIQLVFKSELPAGEELQNADGIFIINKQFSEINFSDFKNLPVFINSVIDTLSDLSLPPNVSRINGWNGFLEREIWEIATNNKEPAENLLQNLGWKTIFVKDQPGFVAARVISRIINEAFFALEENVSTVEEIDLAMKLGTNYPYGPFEWVEKIGTKNIFDLLNRLKKENVMYEPAPALKNFLNR